MPLTAAPSGRPCLPLAPQVRTATLPLLVAALLAGAAAPGCSTLKLRLVDASVRKPSNVAVYFTVDTSSGQPVADLGPEDFRIYEDGKAVSTLESKQTILQQEIAAVHFTLLLVDLSGSVVGSGDMPALIEAASAFADRVAPYQKVALYAFDGSPHITSLVGFGGNVRAGVASLASHRTRDPSTNLNGGVVEAVKVLSRQMDAAPQPLRFGTLVVFTDGTDRAHRVSGDEVRKALDLAAFETFAIGVGAEVDGKELRAIGRSATFASQNRADIARGFDEVARRIEAASRRFYLLSYCSPSRAGEHDLEVEAVADGRSGRLKHHFNAAGFGPQCDPGQKPAFDVRHPRMPVTGPGVEDGGRSRGSAPPASPIAAPPSRDGRSEGAGDAFRGRGKTGSGGGGSSWSPRR